MLIGGVLWCLSCCCCWTSTLCDKMFSAFVSRRCQPWLNLFCLFYICFTGLLLFLLLLWCFFYLPVPGIFLICSWNRLCNLLSGYWRCCVVILYASSSVVCLLDFKVPFIAKLQTDSNKFMSWLCVHLIPYIWFQHPDCVRGRFRKSKISWLCV